MIKYDKPHSNSCFCKMCKAWVLQKAELAVEIARANFPAATENEIEDEAVRLLDESWSKHPEFKF